MSFESITIALREMRWGAAPDWSPRALEWLHEYYRRLAPYWPANQGRLGPADREIQKAVVGTLAPADQERIRAAIEAIRNAAQTRRERVESTTMDLVPLILGWALAVESGKIAAAVDPGVPLMDLFAAGFQLQFSDVGVEIHYSTGWMTAPVPTRAQLGV